MSMHHVSSYFNLINSSFNDLADYDCLTGYLVFNFNLLNSNFFNSSTSLLIESHCSNGGNINNCNMVSNIQKGNKWGLFELVSNTFYVNYCIFKKNIFSKLHSSYSIINFNYCSIDNNLYTTYSFNFQYNCEKLLFFTNTKINFNQKFIQYLFFFLLNLKN